VFFDFWFFAANNVVSVLIATHPRGRRRRWSVHFLLIAASLAAVHTAAGAINDGNAIKPASGKIDTLWVFVFRSLRTTAPGAAAGLDQHRHVDVG
jgi:hypothetical protein